MNPNLMNGVSSNVVAPEFVPVKKGRMRAPLRAIIAVAALFSLMLVGQTSALAATTSGYPTARVQYMASTRTAPWVRADTYWGFALAERGSSQNQTVSVMCWYDGSWATGNYATNRWFKVLVWESYDGYQTPRWLFVHASYVFNQPAVRKCIASSTGYW